MHNIRLNSDLVSGGVSIGVIDSLPFDGIQLLLGNDLTGERVTVNPIMTNKPCSIPISTVIEQEIPNLYPSCAVTRAMAKQQKIENNQGDELRRNRPMICPILFLRTYLRVTLQKHRVRKTMLLTQKACQHLISLTSKRMILK